MLQIPRYFRDQGKQQKVDPVFLPAAGISEPFRKQKTIHWECESAHSTDYPVKGDIVGKDTKQRLVCKRCFDKQTCPDMVKDHCCQGDHLYCASRKHTKPVCIKSFFHKQTF